MANWTGPDVETLIFEQFSRLDQLVATFTKEADLLQMLLRLRKNVLPVSACDEFPSSSSESDHPTPPWNTDGLGELQDSYPAEAPPGKLGRPRRKYGSYDGRRSMEEPTERVEDIFEKIEQARSRYAKLTMSVSTPSCRGSPPPPVPTLSTSQVETSVAEDNFITSPSGIPSTGN